MTWFRTSVSQRTAAALALLGVLAYATLVPWHLSSRFAERSIERTLFAALHVNCLPGGPQSLAAVDPDAPPSPVENETNCPICKGLAAFHLAVLPAVVAELPALDLWSAFELPVEESGYAGRAVSPRSRGPPLA